MPVALAVALGSAAGCAAGGIDDASVDASLRARIGALGLTGDPSAGLDLPSVDDPRAQLGKLLFYSKALGGDMDAACASCHHPLLGGGDGLAVSVGVGAADPDLLGPGRMHESGAPNVPRNAPSVFNSGLWQRTLFHDGRIERLDPSASSGPAAGVSGLRTPDVLPGLPDPVAGPNLVAAQSRFPIVSPAEMLGYSYAAHKPHHTIREYLAARLGGYGTGTGELDRTTWAAEFERVYGSGMPVEALVTEQNVAAALGAYEQSQVFVDTPWGAYVNGDDTAISASAKRGALLFFTDIDDGGAGCATCHSGDFFTDEQLYVLAVPQVGPGRHDDAYADPSLSVADDYGCWYATYQEKDRYAFRTPTLLNVEVTGPYGHDGAYATLEGIVRHHLDPAGALASYDPSQLEPGVQTERLHDTAEAALAKLASDRAAGRTPLQDVSLSEEQVDDILDFLSTLTDPCVEDPACLQPWLPEPTDPDPDGHRLVARFATGKASP